MDRAKYEVIRYEIPPNLVLPIPHIQIFFSAPCSQTCSVRGYRTVERSRHTTTHTHTHTHTQNRKITVLYISIFSTVTPSK